MNTVLVTGGAGYIGSHTVLQLLNEGLDVVVVDNLSNSSYESLRRVSQLAGRTPIFIQGDIRDSLILDRIFSKYQISSVMHFAGLKAVGESFQKPLTYFENNVQGSLVLLQAMKRAEIYEFVFSSSATVYGVSATNPIKEHFFTNPMNPYGRSKMIVEDILRDICESDACWRVAILRYFNPVGAHSSGLIGEDPCGIPNNLLPYITQVASGKYQKLSIFGKDYPTPDGTGVRDYIHVVDLADGHLRALKALKTRAGSNVWNLGTGNGYSVLEVLKAFEDISGKKIPYDFVERRSGDVAVCFADSTKSTSELGWSAKAGLHEMLRDAWNWQKNNPRGYFQS